MPMPFSPYRKKSSLPQDRLSTQAMPADIIAMSANQATMPAIIPLPSIVGTQTLTEIETLSDQDVSLK